MAIRISLEFCKVLAPNCGGADNIEITFTCTDSAAKQGTVRLIGTKNAINSINESNSLAIDGTNGPSSFLTPFGNISILGTFESGFNIDENVTVKLHVIDCDGWNNIDDDIGKTNALMTNTNHYVNTDNDEYIAFV